MDRGFSLLETVIVLALVSLIIYGASNVFLGHAPKHRLNKAAWEIQTRLNYARHKAVFEVHPNLEYIGNLPDYAGHIGKDQGSDVVMGSRRLNAGVFFYLAQDVAEVR